MISRRGRLLSAALLAGCAFTAGCAAPEGAAPTVTATDFAAGERRLMQRGRLRTDRAAADIPVTAGRLVENFRRVAFGLERDANDGRGAHVLHRYEGPVRWWVHAAPADAGAIADVTAAFDRLAMATGLDIVRAAGSGSADFHVMFLAAKDYPSASQWARRALGRHEARLIEEFRTRPVLCQGSVRIRASAGGGLPAGAHESALVLIRAGYSDLLRRGCVEEELAQALGLANDDPRVRPSVFNDDEEFALLTVHDELLLRILYDRRLRSGMTATEAMPLVARIAAELRPGEARRD